jgi:predicted phosphodiesterase
MPHPDFLVLQTQSSAGHVFIIGDVHGAHGALNQVIETLNPNDTLIIVGDLIDRSFDKALRFTSAAVLDHLIDLNNNPDAPRIYAIKGNHEMDFLKAYHIFFDEDENEPNTKANRAFLRALIKNGGGWIFKHPEGERRTHVLHQWFMHYLAKTPGYEEKCNNIVNNFIVELLDADDISDYVIDTIHSYKRYLDSLPYLIKLEGEYGVEWVVHAALFFTDDELNARINGDEGFSEQEKVNMTQARFEEYTNNHQRNDSSSWVYCGHNIITNVLIPVSNRTVNRVCPVRLDTKEINLDVGACVAKGFVVLNQTTGEATVVATDETIESERVFLDGIAQEVTAALTPYRQKPSRIPIVPLSIFNSDKSLKASENETTEEAKAATHPSIK